MADIYDTTIGGPASAPMKLRKTLAQLLSFGTVGGIAFLVDIGLYNLLRATVLETSPIWSKVVSVAVATGAAWLGNRYLTFRAERTRNTVREGLLFAVVNVLGLLIAAACLFISHYVLGFTSQLADNISGNGIGLVLGTVFRYLAYRYFVFPGSASTEVAVATPTVTHMTDRTEAVAPLS